MTREEAIIITGFTGVLCCPLEVFHRDASRRARRPVFTHQLGSHFVAELYHEDFMRLIENLTDNSIKLQFYKQTIFGSVEGDCDRTCLATLIGMHPHDIPNFAALQDQWGEACAAWLAERGWHRAAYNAPQPDVNAWWIERGLHIAVGKSPRGDYNHAVLIEVTGVNPFTFTFLHDPHPDDTFLDGPVKQIERVYLVPRYESKP